MRPRTEIPAGQVGMIRRAMPATSNKSSFQRLQCLWLRARQDLSTDAIAQTVAPSKTSAALNRPLTKATPWPCCAALRRE